MSKKIILGFTGLIASGKGTAAKYLVEKHSAVSFRFSTILRDLLDRLYMPQSRDNMVNISKVLREEFGQDLLSKVMIKDIEQADANIVVIDGMRRPADIQDLKDLPGLKVVAIEVDAKTRHARLNKRSENPDDQTKTWEQFLKDHEKETEITIPDLMKQADVTVDNNGSLEDFYKQLDKLVK